MNEQQARKIVSEIQAIGEKYNLWANTNQIDTCKVEAGFILGDDNSVEVRLPPVVCKKCGRILLKGEVGKAEIKCMKCKYINKFGM